MSRRAILISSLGLTVAVTAAEAQRPSPPVEPGTRTAVACTVGTLQAVAPAGSTIRKATRVAAKGPLPDFCQIDGEVATPGNAVGLRLRLPATWNGKFYFHGVGGFGGSVEPSSAGANSPAPGLARGYAVASTDTGHQGGSQD
jgi:feruloyl esterase